MTALRPPLRAAALGLVLALATGIPAAADEAFDGFITGLRDLCSSPPATRCTRAVHGFLDLDGNGAIALAELEAVRTLATAAVQEKQSTISAQERGLVGLALLGLRYADPAQVFGNFDADGDGGVDHGELFADFRLDGRAFADVVEDREAVDWESFANRFGKVGKAFVAMLPPATDGR